MRVLEKRSIHPGDKAHAAAFRARLAPISRFVSRLNDSLDAPISLLAVRDGTKFDFVLKDVGGKVIGVIKPLVSSDFPNAVVCIHIQTTSPPRSSGEFYLNAAGVASAADMISVNLGRDQPAAAVKP